jgi:hypothetical protein
MYVYQGNNNSGNRILPLNGPTPPSFFLTLHEVCLLEVEVVRERFRSLILCGGSGIHPFQECTRRRRVGDVIQEVALTAELVEGSKILEILLVLVTDVT